MCVGVPSYLPSAGCPLGVPDPRQHGARAARPRLSMLALLPLSAISALTWSARTVSVPCRPALLRMEATDSAAVATLVVAAAVSAAEEYAVKAGAGSAGDLFGAEGIEPVLSAALAAASADAALAAEVQRIHCSFALGAARACSAGVALHRRCVRSGV